jgi:peptidylprolyl isomerase
VKRDQLIFVGALAVAAVVAVVVVLITGGDDGSSSSDASVDTSTKPTVEVPDGPPPTTLQVDDIVVGDGAEATAGDTLTMQYVGVNYDDGKQFDASWDNGAPYVTQIGVGAVIPGWDQGLVGQTVGSRVLLVVPSKLGYGEEGSGAIKPGDDLVFAVDILAAYP